MLAIGCSESPRQEQGNGEAGTQAPPQAPAAASPGELQAAEKPLRITLYFANDTGGLASETREMSRVEPPSQRARQIVEALVAGPRRGLARAIPGDTQVRAVHLGSDGTAFVDLDQAFSRGLAQGSEDALLAVQSIAETLAANLEEVQRVKILVEGEEVRDLGGHLDLSRPLVPEGRPGDARDGGEAARR